MLERKFNSRLISLITGKKRKKAQNEKNTTDTLTKFMKQGVKQMKKDLKL